jgi:hypothetical protein
VPFGVTTVTSTIAPEAPAGDVAVIDESLFTLKDAAATVPKLTAVAPVKPLPVIVTVSPPPGSVPVVGDIAVTTGAAVEGVVELPLKKNHPAPMTTRTTIIQTTVEVFIENPIS